MNRTLSIALLVTMTHAGLAQQAPPLSKQAAAIKSKVDTLQPRDHISVVPIHGSELFGDYVSDNQEAFVLFDIDQHREVKLLFTEVRKVKNGYGGYNSARGRHTDHTKAIIITLIVAGSLIGIIVAAAASK